MTVVCVFSGPFADRITHRKQYEVIEEVKSCYLIVDDTGKEDFYPACLFRNTEHEEKEARMRYLTIPMFTLLCCVSRLLGNRYLTV